MSKGGEWKNKHSPKWALKLSKKSTLGIHYRESRESWSISMKIANLANLIDYVQENGRVFDNYEILVSLGREEI